MISISEAGLPLAIERQAAAGVAEADVVIVLTDGQAGVQAGDAEIAGWLRQYHPDKPVVLAVNKCENVAKSAIMVRPLYLHAALPVTLTALPVTLYMKGNSLLPMVNLKLRSTALEMSSGQLLCWSRRSLQFFLTSPHVPLLFLLRFPFPSYMIPFSFQLFMFRCAPAQVADFYEFGYEPFPVSAISGTGTGEFLDQLMARMPPPKSSREEDIGEKPLSIAIVGRPNVGKSSLLNAICGEERAIVCDMSGTTRDAVDTDVTLPTGEKITLIDTAGIRKRAKVRTGQSKYTYKYA